MAWNSNFSIYYDCNIFPGMSDAKSRAQVEMPSGSMGSNANERKRRLTADQIDSLERNFQEEFKLEPERKIRLANELGLQPRQVAVWFQNRRARWKAKQLERLYTSLKQDFDVVSKEKQKLQDEVMNLKAQLEEKAPKQALTEEAEEAEDETVESSVIPRSSATSNKLQESTHNQLGDCSYMFTIEDYWGAFPAYP